MTTPFELVRPGRPADISPATLNAREVPEGLHDLSLSAATFEIDDGLADAVNVALAVGAPLLLTGEPGTGKTQVAYFLVHYFGIETVGEPLWRQPFVFDVKSTSSARDVLYSFDTVEYFHRAQRGGGETIDKRSFVRKGPLWRALDELEKDPPSPAILLIDEIDKAPRDFPNDLLRELDQYTFEVHETSEVIERPRGLPPPVVVITSNSEKLLPKAFLRRCIFHHIEFSEKTLRRAIQARRRIGGLRRLDEATLDAARQHFMRLREHDLSKKPATAEFLVWLTALDVAGITHKRLQERGLPMLAALIKDTDDRKAILAHGF